MTSFFLSVLFIQAEYYRQEFAECTNCHRTTKLVNVILSGIGLQRINQQSKSTAFKPISHG